MPTKGNTNGNATWSWSDVPGGVPRSRLRKARNAASEQPPPEPFRVTDAMLAEAQRYRKPDQRQQQRRAFEAPKHPPGVVPSGSRGIAQDEAFIGAEGVFTWANAAIGSAYLEGMIWLGYAELSVLAQRAEYRVLSEEIAAEMTREWIEIKSTGEDKKDDKIKQLNDAMERYRVRDVFRQAATHDGLFGRGHIYIDTGDTDKPEELRQSIGEGREDVSRMKVEHGGLVALRNVEPVWAYPTRYNSIDPLKADWYRPEHWFVMSKEVHRTRFLTLIGREVPDILKPAYSFGGLSMTQMAKPYVDNWLRTRQSIADLIASFTTWVLSTNMGATLGPFGDTITKRADYFNIMRQNSGVMLINNQQPPEEFQNISAPLGTLDQLQAQAQEHMAAVGRIPIVKLLGIQPAGLNASSEGEIRSYFDWIHAFQEMLFRVPLSTVLDFMQLSEFGEVDPELEFSFKPLWQLDEAAKAQIAATRMQTDTGYEQIQAISSEEVRQRLASDPDSPYQGLNLEDRPAPPDPNSLMGMMGGAAQSGEAPPVDEAKLADAPRQDETQAPRVDEARQEAPKEDEVQKLARAA